MIQLLELIFVLLTVCMCGYILVNQKYRPTKKPNKALAGLVLVVLGAILFLTLGKFIPSIQVIESQKASLLTNLLVLIIFTIVALEIYKNKSLKNKSA